MMSVTVLEKHEHYFDLENQMPVHPRKAPKEIYKDTLIARGGFFIAGILVAVVLSIFPNVWEPLNYLPGILMLVAIVGIFDALFKNNQEWHQEKRYSVKQSPASYEISEKLMGLNALYKGRRDDSVMFNSPHFGAEDFFIYHVWERYIQVQNPTKKELRKGFGNAHTGGVIHINDNEGWSFNPEFVSPNRYKVTVKRVCWDDNR